MPSCCVFCRCRIRSNSSSSILGISPSAHRKQATVTSRCPCRFSKPCGGAAPEEAHGELVSGNYFPALGVQPVLGRGFTAQDESNHAPVAVLSFAYWNGRFAAAPDVLGRTLYVKGNAFTIVGVAPAGFQGTDPGQPAMDFWVQLQQRPDLNPFGTPPTDHTLYGSPEWLSLVMVGRLRPGVSPEQAAA